MATAGGPTMITPGRTSTVTAGAPSTPEFRLSTDVDDLLAGLRAFVDAEVMTRDEQAGGLLYRSPAWIPAGRAYQRRSR